MSTRFTLPAETARHIATILGFPSRGSLPSFHYQNACHEIAQLATVISQFELVRIYTRPEDVTRAQSMIRNTDCSPFGVDIIPFKTNHLWVRDTGPVYVHGPTLTAGNKRQRYAIDFGFNEWGKKYALDYEAENDSDWPQMQDEQYRENATFAKQVIENDIDPSPVTCLESKVCLEGGALVHDGDGTLIASESSIIDDARNPGLSKGTIEEELSRLLGVEKIIWFPGFKGLDITDVHADAEVQFIKPGTVVLSRPHHDAPKEWLEVYGQVKAALQSEKDAKDRQFKIYTIDEPDPMPDPNVTKQSSEFQEAPATNYVNFYFVNGGLILPKFGDEVKDREALETMQDLCPDRKVKQVSADTLALHGGVIHCSTQPVLDVNI